MIPRSVRLCLAVSLSLLAFGARAQQAPSQLPTNPAAATDDPPTNQLKLPDADIDTVLTALEQFTGRTVLRPAALPTAPGGYNLRLANPVTKAEAVRAIETVLSLNGIGVSPLGDKFLIVSPLNLTRTTAPEMITGSTLDMPPSGRIAMKVFQLQFLKAQEFQAMIATILNPTAGGALALMQANAVMITDTVANLQRVETLLRDLDQPVSVGFKPKFYQLKNGAKASSVVQQIRTVLQPLAQQLGTGTTYNADDRTNQIILVTDPRQYVFFDELIDKLDVRADPNTRNEVIYLKHATAADVVTVVNGIISRQTAAIQRVSQSTRRQQNLGQQPNQPNQPNVPPGAQPGVQQPQGPTFVSAGGGSNNSSDILGAATNEFSDIVAIANDDRTNAIVVSGTTDDIRLLRELIDKLDVVLAQVRIEVVIAEVTLGDNHQSGIAALGLRLQGDKLVGFTGSDGSTSIVGPDGSAGSFANIIDRADRPGISTPWGLDAVISVATTPRKDNTTILSVPSITTSHAKEATVFVGEERPIQTGSVNSGLNGGTTSTTQQVPIGINLTVTPLIGADGSVQLDIQQDVDEVGPNLTIDGNPVPIIFKRNTSSFVSVKSGEIIVLGGLQRQRTLKRTSRLGPIPIIGDLLGARQSEVVRTELLFFLRPHVLTNTPADNTDAFKRIDELPQRDAIHKQIDPNYVPPSKPLLDRILPR